MLLGGVTLLTGCGSHAAHRHVTGPITDTRIIPGRRTGNFSKHHRTRWVPQQYYVVVNGRRCYLHRDDYMAVHLRQTVSNLRCIG